MAVGLSGYKDIIDNAYDLAELSKHVEYFTVMTYDYHGNWEGKLGHVSPLYYRDGDRNPYYSTVSGRGVGAGGVQPEERLSEHFRSRIILRHRPHGFECRRCYFPRRVCVVVVVRPDA